MIYLLNTELSLSLACVVNSIDQGNVELANDVVIVVQGLWVTTCNGM